MNIVTPGGGTAIVVTADRGIFQLLYGLLLSLRPLDRARYAVCVLDVGLTDAQRDRVMPLCDTLERSRDDRLVWPHPDLVAKLNEHVPFWKALMSRPFVRDYFPGFRHYIQVDGDVWAQSLGVFDAAVRELDAGNVVVAPESDVAYPFLTSHAYNAHYVDERAALYRRYFGDEVAKLVGALPHFNIGFCGLQADAPHWDTFRERLSEITKTTFHFLCEQVVLNLVMLENRNFRLFPATCNWMCNLATPIRDANGIWRSPVHPHPEIELLHLCGTEKLERYAPLGLLYDNGRYLQDIAGLY